MKEDEHKPFFSKSDKQIITVTAWPEFKIRDILEC